MLTTIIASTVLLLHMDGSSFTDSSGTGKTVSTIGDAAPSTAQSVFGGSSAAFDNANDAITLAGSPDFNFGTGDFTIDFRVRPHTWAGPGTYDFAFGYLGATGFHYYLSLAGDNFYVQNGINSYLR